MSRPGTDIRLTQEASFEIEAAARWYEEQRRGLGSEFIVAVEAALANVSRTPMLFPAVYREVRRALLKRFPYALFFRIGDGFIDIISVFHLRRNPHKLKNR